jgi:hypothetical protein
VSHPISYCPCYPWRQEKISFNEDFDFEQSNAKFDKTEIANEGGWRSTKRQLGEINKTAAGGDQQNGSWRSFARCKPSFLRSSLRLFSFTPSLLADDDVTPAYNKDDFFDNLSRENTNTEG